MANFVNVDASNIKLGMHENQGKEHGLWRPYKSLRKWGNVIIAFPTG
jgi:hypothetical protein